MFLAACIPVIIIQTQCFKNQIPNLLPTLTPALILVLSLEFLSELTDISALSIGALQYLQTPIHSYCCDQTTIPLGGYYQCSCFIFLFL